MKSKLFFLLFIILTALFLFTACSPEENGELPADEEISRQEELTEEELKKEIESIEAEYEAEEREDDSGPGRFTSTSPFTGMPVSDDFFKRAIAVSIENSPAARPQSGLDQAEVVYEFMLEGGITRFLALFWPDIPDKVGPIRSARPALIETALAYDALILHAGASPDGFAMLANENARNLDQIYQSQYYWRSSKRRAPHNLYSGKPTLDSYLNNLGEKEYPDQFGFLTASVISDFNEAAEIFIDYWGAYNVIYKYSSLDNNYFRFLNDSDTPHLVESGNQIKVKNIIVQYVSTETKDDQGRQELDLDSGGDIKLFRDGVVINGSWEKENGRIIYLTENGREIEINPGKTWIQIVSTGTDVNY